METASRDAGGVSLFPESTTRSTRFRHALSRIALFSRYDGVTVVIEGECGTGKTFFARYLHKGSSRSDRSFYHVNIAALDDALVSSELFGHVSGAFTGADRARPGLFVSAHGGTLFLDEIAKATTQVQCRLLSVVERRAIRPVGADREVPVDVRLVAASNVSLRRLTSEGEFLPDLLDRLGHFRVEIPPLRDRRADIPGLVENFVTMHAPAFGYAGTPPAVDASLLRAFELAPWPGNVRELDGTIQRLLATACPEPILTLDHCDDDLQYLLEFVRGPRSQQLTPAGVERVVTEVGSISEAARMLNIARSTVQRHLRKQRNEASDAEVPASPASLQTCSATPETGELTL